MEIKKLTNAAHIASKWRTYALILICWAGSFTELAAQYSASNDFYFKGSIRCIEPISISLKTIQGDVILQGTISPKNPNFSLGPIQLPPDLYLMNLGTTTEKIYISNKSVHISGYYDNKVPAQSNLNIEGLEKHFKLMELPLKANDQEVVKPELLTSVKGTEASALAYLYSIRKYDYLKPFYDKLSSQDFKTSTGRWLQQTMDSLKTFASGIAAPSFTLPNAKGIPHRLETYRGKIVVLDFWASWCGPCRSAMEKMKVYYPEFKDKVQFISISVDDSESKWRIADEQEKIPWISLWDSTGFRPTSAMSKAYGFTAIPFMVLIDAKGQVLRRDIASAEQLKEELKKLLQ